jgi:hypothetical protein
MIQTKTISGTSAENESPGYHWDKRLSRYLNEGWKIVGFASYEIDGGTIRNWVQYTAILIKEE